MNEDTFQSTIKEWAENEDEVEAWVARVLREPKGRLVLAMVSRAIDKIREAEDGRDDDGDDGDDGE